ncbi:hypothetical protein CDL60_19460 [Roseateles noduli]|nr:hypothetical protein CDL60_19460 [Roseateles noduli]
MIQREPAPGAAPVVPVPASASASTPAQGASTAPAQTGQPGQTGQSSTGTVNLQAMAEKIEDHPLIIGLVRDLYQDLRYGSDFSLDERNKLKLKGTESASYFGLYSALTLPLGGVGGLRYGPDFGTSLSTAGKYLDAIEPLTPSLSLKTDLASRIVGLRVDEYLASDRFLRRLKDNYQTLILAGVLAQIGIMVKAHATEGEADSAGLADDTWNADLALVKGVVGLVFKEKLKAPGVFDIGPLLMPSHPFYAADSYFGGNLPQGLSLDSAQGAEGRAGRLQHFGGTVNLAQFASGGVDTGDTRKYRGWQGSVWGDYRDTQPTPELGAQGVVPDRRFRAGALFGDSGVFLLGEVGGHFSGAQADRLTSMFFTEGLAYAPAEGPLRKMGFKITHMSLQPGDTLADPAGGGAAQGGWATRASPFADFDFKLGGGIRWAWAPARGSRDRTCDRWTCPIGAATSATPTSGSRARKTSRPSGSSCRPRAAGWTTSTRPRRCCTGCAPRCRSATSSTARR